MKLTGYDFIKAKECIFEKINPRKYPEKWSQQKPNQIVQIVDLEFGSPEYFEVFKIFARSMPKTIVTGIQRIENRHLWTVFQTEVDQMTERNGG